MSLLGRIASQNPSRVRLREVNAEFAASVPPDAIVLDAGAGEAPYRDLFAHAQYESADFEQVDKRYAPSTYVCDLCAIPVEDDRFDYIVFNQVMEHLPEPRKALTELYRVLKPGGKLLYTAPLCYEEHEQPYDFYRYTRFAVDYLFTDVGFEFETLEWLEGYYATAGYHLSRMSHYLPHKPSELNLGIWNLPLFLVVLGFRVLFRAGAIFFQRLDLASDYDLRGYPKNYFAVVRKPKDEPKDSDDSQDTKEHLKHVRVHRRRAIRERK